MEMTDKAVSTEDLGQNFERNTSLEAARLEAVINTLVENKFENIKRKPSSLHSSPKNLLNKLKGTSISTVSTSSDKGSDNSVNRKCNRLLNKCGQGNGRSLSISSAKNLKYSKVLHGDGKSTAISTDGGGSGGEDNKQFRGFNQQSSSITDCTKNCYCRQDTNGSIRMHFDDDYISLKIEEYDDMDAEEIIARHTRRIQRKKRRRKHRQIRNQMALNQEMSIPINDDSFKVLDPDELSQRARFTIVVTACLLLFMCLLLVGITLRMAPIIDDMVRKENEELMNALNNREVANFNSLHNSTASVLYNLT